MRSARRLNNSRIKAKKSSTGKFKLRILSISSTKIITREEIFLSRPSSRNFPNRWTGDNNRFFSHHSSRSKLSYKSRLLRILSISPAYHCSGLISDVPIAVISIAAQVKFSACKRCIVRTRKLDFPI